MSACSASRSLTHIQTATLGYSRPSSRRHDEALGRVRPEMHLLGGMRAMGAKPRDVAIVMPQLQIMAVDQLARLFNGLLIICAFDLLHVREVAVCPDGVNSIFRHEWGSFRHRREPYRSLSHRRLGRAARSVMASTVRLLRGANQARSVASTYVIWIDLNFEKRPINLFLRSGPRRWSVSGRP